MRILREMRTEIGANRLGCEGHRELDNLEIDGRNSAPRFGALFTQCECPGTANSSSIQHGRSAVAERVAGLAAFADGATVPNERGAKVRRDRRSSGVRSTPPRDKKVGAHARQAAYRIAQRVDDAITSIGRACRLGTRKLPFRRTPGSPS